MNTYDKKTEVLTLLSQTNDSSLIDDIYDMLHPETTIKNINLQELPSELQQKINKALDDYKTGNFSTQEQKKQKVQRLNSIS